jgi:hypothetical protein
VEVFKYFPRFAEFSNKFRLRLGATALNTPVFLLGRSELQAGLSPRGKIIQMRSGEPRDQWEDGAGRESGDKRQREILSRIEVSGSRIAEGRA